MGYFSRSYEHFNFEMYSLSHFFIMAIFIVVSITIYRHRSKMVGKKWRITEIAAAISLVLIELIYHLWMYMTGSWNVSHSIPLELCSISLILSVCILFTRKKIFFDLLFFTGILGCTQAIFFPSLNYAFPHFRFFHFFYTHLMNVWVAFYFTWARGYRPTIQSVVRLLVFLNLLLPILLIVNKYTGGNYLYLSHKPNHVSLLDVLGPYPWYILSMEILVIILSLLTWAIFKEKKIKTKLSNKKMV